MRTLERQRNAGHSASGRPGNRARTGSGDLRLAQRAQQAPATLGPADLLTMQRTVGNHAVQRAVAAGSRPTVRMGSNSPAVKALQEALISAGAAITADGAFGPKTHAAVAAFQKAGGLTADGVVGPKTWAKVDSGGVTIGAPGAPPGSGPLPALASAKLAELKTLLAQAQGKTPPTTTTTTPATATAPPSGTAPVAADAWGHDWWDDVTETVGGAVDTVTDTVGGVVDTVTETVSDVVDTVTDTVGGVVDTVTDAAGAVVDTVTETVGGAVNAVTDVAGGVWNQVQEAADEVGAAIGSVADSVKEYLGEGYAALQGLLSRIASGLGIGDLGILDGLIAKLKKLVNGESDQEGKEYSGAIETIHGGAVGGSAGCDAPAPSPAAGVRRVPLSMALDLDTATEHGKVPSAASPGPLAFDSVSGKLGFEVETKRDLMQIPESAFGYAGPVFDIAGGLWRTNSSWWSDHVDVKATVSLTNVWDIQSRGKISVPSADADVVSSGNWEDIIADLTPGPEGVPKRHVYWAPGPTKAHEEFHCQDYTNRAKAYLSTATDWLGAQQVDVPFWDTELVVRKQVKPLLETLAKNFTADAKAHLDNGGEARAYNGTKGHYDTLIAAIRARAATEGWKKK